MIIDSEIRSLLKFAQLLSNRKLHDELDLTPDQAKRLSLTIAGLHHDFMRAMERVLNDNLGLEQVQRLREVRLQAEGLTAFLQPEVQRRLQLTDHQRARVRAIVKDGFAQAKSIRESLPKVQKDMLEKTMVVLTDKQKLAWERIRGRQFVLRERVLAASRVPPPPPSPRSL
ncbi:MAG: hypothetical protein L0387_15560 [Acidobacteria bacterium]|nr:hypothetical protein [Acidobacteriota bacterium]